MLAGWFACASAWRALVENWRLKKLRTVDGRGSRSGRRKGMMGTGLAIVVMQCYGGGVFSIK